MAGAFDNLKGIKRSSFFAGENENDNTSFIEKLIRYGNRIQTEKQSMQQSLFGDPGVSSVIKKPTVPAVEEWPKIILLDKEKELIGIYLTSHPLDDYKLEIENFCSKEISIKDIKNDIIKYKDREFSVGGMVTSAREGVSKNGKPFSTLTLSDYSDSYEFFFFGQDYVNFQKYCKPGLFILVKGAVRQKFRSEFYEFKALQIELLSEVRRKYVKSVTINLQLNIISEIIIEEIEELAKNNKGSTLLKFKIYDPESNLSLQFFSRNSKIELTDSMLKYFEERPDIGYTIN